MKENFDLIKKNNNNNQVHSGESSIKENLENSSSNKFTPRDKTNFKLKFEQLKNKKDITLDDLEELMENDDTNEEYIEYYLDIVSKKFSSILNKKLMLFFPVIRPNICSKFHLNKNITEKKRFINLYNKIIDTELNSQKLDEIILNEFNFPIELSLLKFNDDENEKNKNINRWGIYYNRILDFHKIDNEEYFYYTIMNHMVKNFKDSSINKKLYHQSLINISDSFNALMSITNNNSKYSTLLEYIILFILNSQDKRSLMQIDNIYLYNIFLNAISYEINSIKSLTIEEIKKEFLKYKNNIDIKDNDLIFPGYTNKIIKNFNNYYITEEFIKNVSKMRSIKEDFLINYTNLIY